MSKLIAAKLRSVVQVIVYLGCQSLGN